MADEAREERGSGIGEQARALREDFAPEKINQKLEEVARERPKTRHLLDFSIVGKALVAAVVVALLLLLLVSAQVAAIALVVVFLGGWLLGAQLSYDRRRETHEAERERERSDEPDGRREDEPRAGKEPDDGAYQADRGEVEAEQEQEGEAGDGGQRGREAGERA